MKVYLAGGMRPRIRHDAHGNVSEFNWQDVVKQHLQTFRIEVFDPRDHQTKEFAEYSFLDLLRIRQCDVVIAYIEADHPGPYGLASEVAFAKGLGKTVLLINEQHENRYIRFAENFADIVFHKFEDALVTINKI